MKKALQISHNGRLRLIVAGLAMLIFYLAIPLPSPLFPDDYSTVILGEAKNDSLSGYPILRAFLNRNQQWCLPPRPDLPIPSKLEKAVLFYEDRYFYYHPGVNPGAVLRAALQNFRGGKRISGASTLTMQVARLLNPKQRSYANKLLEILQSLKIEVCYSKQEILRFYLDHAPYGGNVVGFQAAALRYFGKLPHALTWGEAATLAVLPNAPGLISPAVAPEKLQAKRDRLLLRMKTAGVITEKNYQLALLETVPDVSQPFPWQAPHLCQWLHSRHGANGGLIRTTVVPELQEMVERLLRERVRYLSHQGIKNGAVIVVETRTGRVRAYAGSQDFFDAATNGQVDGVRAPRSSGSLLKPFLYALAIDDGIMLPQTLLRDVPTFYGAFSPSNASEQFDGMVVARQALTRSLNVPAVRLLNTYGLYPFYRFLKTAGVSTLFRDADDYGLPLIIGGAEITLWDITMLFRGLGNGGKFEPLSVLPETDAFSRPSAANISPAASYLTLQMLRDVQRPGSEFFWELFRDRYPIAWKTGTSYGQRDGWAVGVTPQWTIAVWVGNFTGEGNANLAGAKSAGPLLFDIFNSLPKDPQLHWFAEPANDFRAVSLCRDTGFLAGTNCPETVFTNAPKHGRPLRQCDFHHKIYVSTITGNQVCSRCWQEGKYQPRAALIYPVEVVQYLRGRGQMIGEAPLHNPDCPVQNGFSPLEILYPQSNARLWVPRDFGGNIQKVTARAAHRENRRKIFWYLNDRYLGSTENRHEQPLDCRQGWNELEIVDEIGYRESRRFFVNRKQ